MSRSRSATCDPDQMPLAGFVEFVLVGNGVYQAIQPRLVRKVSITKAAKITGSSRDIIYRLYKTGFIEGDQSSPGKIMVDLQSAQTHFQDAKDPEFWTEERRRQYRGLK